MSRDTIYIREIEIHRALGIRRGEGFALAELSPGINLIFGPNGSGKSTTCKVMQELLWPGYLQRPTVSGIVVVDDDEWRIDVDAGHPQTHRNGQIATLPDFGSREHRSRYLLGLKELIIDDSSDFAKAIADASQGGYDLEEAAQTLDFRMRPKSRKSECDRVQERNGEVDEARRRQIQVDHEADRLEDLRRQLDEAVRAGRELELLRKAREYHEAVSRCRDVKLEIDTFPDGVDRLQGDERKQLDALADEVTDLTDQQTAEEERHAQARRELEVLGLPEEGIPDDRLLELRALTKSLRDTEARIIDERRRRDEALAAVEESLRRLGHHITGDQLALIASIEDLDLDTFARRVHRLRAKENVLAERRSWLSMDEPADTRLLSENELHEGIGVLARWLSSPPHSWDGRRPSWLSRIAILLLLVSAVILLIAQTWTAAAIVLIACVLLGVEWWRTVRRSTAAASNPRDVFRTSYLSLSLPEPEVWSDEVVLSRLRDLIRLNGAKALFTERRSRLDQLASDEETLTRAREELEMERARVEEDLGLSLEIEDEWLPLLVDRIRSWQKATSQVASAEALLAKPTGERVALVERINQYLSDYGYEPVETTDAVEVKIADLERRRNRHDSAHEALKRASERIERSIRPGLKAASSRRAEIFRRLALDDGQEAVLDEWLDRHPKYKELTETFAKDDAVCSDRSSALEARTDLLAMDRSEIELHIQTCQATADRRDHLSQTIGEITRQIKVAKEGYVLSDALERRDDARFALAEARDENGRAVTGAVLTEWIRQEAVERSRPQVFERANQLFIRFTRGSLRLEMDDHGSAPAFVARRGSYPIQSLNELSDGERIQLMIAVRLAFLEQDEARRLPLLVDEVLGTSDDGRSGVLIDTLIEVARQGRQVFYCTAQHDEVGKWKARLLESDVPFEVSDLGEIRGGSVERADPLDVAFFETNQPPSPSGMTYEEYGETLGVFPPDPGLEIIDDVHLWYVLDRPELIYELLCKGIMTWGQLQTLIDHGGAGLVDARDDAFDRARAAAKALRAGFEARRVGRGKVVDRSVLLDSGCVSDRFIDEVAGLARGLEGDAGAIIRALEGGAVSYWLSKNTERLREYLEDEGYLLLEAPLSRHDIRVRIFAAVADELRSGLLKRTFIDRLAARLCAEVAVVEESV